MSPRNLLLIVIAVVFAAGTAMFVRNRANAPVEEVQAPVTASRVLVAKRDISAGSFVNAGTDLDWKDWPEENIQPGYVKEGTEDLGSYQGAVVRHTLHAGDPVTAALLVKPGAGGFLAAVLEPGKRAVSVAVSPTSGTSGFIFPGDRVDLMLTHRVKVQETSTDQPHDSVVTETFVQNVRVVAVDQMLDNPENKAILAKTVTVEVTPQDAERISVAEDLGKISFSLRSLTAEETTVAKVAQENKDAPPKAEGGPLEPVDAQEASDSADLVTVLTHAAPVPARAFTRDRDVSRLLGRDSEAKPQVRIIRGDTVEQREFFQEGVN